MNQLRAVTFDFWGTLYQNADGREERLRLLEEVLASHSQARSRAVVKVAYGRAWDLWDRVWVGEQRSITTERWLREFLTALNADLPEDVVAELIPKLEEVHLDEFDGETPRPVPGVTEVIPRLSRRYRLGLISDVGLTPGRVLRALMERDGLLVYFDVFTFSDETGATKPLPEQFLRTLKGLDVAPEEAAHVGDLPETDIVGARRVGMKAILFLGVSRREDGRRLADAVFEEYDALEGLLRSMDGNKAG